MTECNYSDVNRAKRTGELIPQPCEVCGDLKVHSHHENYAKPLDVTWLCPKHHKARHDELRGRLKSTKNEGLRIMVRGTNRKFYLQPPNPKRNQPDYAVRFNVPRDIRTINPGLPKTVFRSTGTCLIAPARERARQIVENVYEGRWNQAERMKLASVYSTLGELLDRYQPSPQIVKPLTAKRNRNALEMILRESLGKREVGNERLDVLTGRLLREWIALRQARVAPGDYVAQERTAITINSMMTQARSVLSPKVLECYEDLRLPDLDSFRAVRKLKVDQDMSYKPIPSAALEALERDAQLLRKGQSEMAASAGITPEEQPQVYLIYLLMIRLGLRNNEVFAARWSWIEREGNRAELIVRRRSDFVSKNKRYGALAIDAQLLIDLDSFRALPDAWIIAAPNPSARFNLCNRKINKWARQFLPAGREKGAYEFRKHAGSVVASRPPPEGGIMAAAAFLRDSIATAEKHYVTYLRSVRGIRSDEISAGHAAA